MKAEKAKQQDNNESAVDKCQIGKPIQIENIKQLNLLLRKSIKLQ